LQLIVELGLYERKVPAADVSRRRPLRTLLTKNPTRQADSYPHFCRYTHNILERDQTNISIESAVERSLPWRFAFACFIANELPYGRAAPEEAICVAGKQSVTYMQGTEARRKNKTMPKDGERRVDAAQRDKLQELVANYTGPAIPLTPHATAHYERFANIVAGIQFSLGRVFCCGF
jgi:hypothetical protein